MTLKSHDPAHVRSVVLAGHAGGGKTTMAEQLLFRAGAIPRLGRVDDGTAHLDYEPEEQKQRRSLSLAVGTFEHGEHEITVVDTPGYPDFIAEMIQGFHAADAALFVVDASEGVTHQDQRLAERVDAAGTAIVIVLNKWDLLDAEGRAQAKIDVADRLAFLSYAPVLTVSALTGKLVQRVLPALRQAEEAYHTRVPTAALNRVIREAQQAHPPPAARKHRPRVLYATQGAADPPTFTLFATHELPPTYLRYLERKIRESFDLGPTPIKLRVRRRNG